MDSDAALARAARRRRLSVGLAGTFVLLLTVGTSLIFAGSPGIGIALVATSVVALAGAIVVLVRR